MELHDSQKKLIDFLKRNPSMDGFSLWGIARETGLKYAQSVSHHIEQLERKGYLRRNQNTGSWEVLRQPIEDVVYIDVYGFAQCGPQSDRFSEGEPEDRIPVSTRLFGIRKPEEIFVVRARGDSMEPQITSGDYVLFKRDHNAPTSGSIALVVDDGEPRIKRVTVDADVMILASSNPKYPPKMIRAEDTTRICGHAVGVIKAGSL